MAQTDQTTPSKDLFMSFVFGLMQSGMMQLGKLVNPVTGKIEKNLAAAQSTIDLLRMLREKTSGNLDKAENDLLNNAISTLQLNYVDEVEHTSAQGPTSDNANDSSRASEGHQSAHTQQ